MAFIFVQGVLLWTHCKAVLSGTKNFRLRDFLNVNIIFMFVGAFLYFTKIRLPGVINSAVKGIADMIGPISMIITGMLLAGLSVKTLKQYRMLWKPVVLRLVAFPLVIVLVFRLIPNPVWAPEADNIFIVSLLAAAAPSASTITMMTQIFGGDEKYASVINLKSHCKTPRGRHRAAVSAK